MKKDTNTMNDMTLNLDVKSNLAKLLATENITIQHNNVKTASFDVKDRVLTLPIFKQKSGDVYDMLIAHECAHALWTPYDKWQGIDNAELRSYVNVLEDTRIDHLIQRKYPGVVSNYKNGFDILEKQNFFGFGGKDINKDFMIIDKINLRSKSMNRLPFDFNDQDNEWVAKVDNLKTFDDVLKLANEMLDWQKEQVEQMSKLPDFDNLTISKSYGIANDDDDFDDEYEETDSENGQGSNSDAEQNDDAADEKNDFNNFGDQKADSESDSNQSGQGDSKSDSKEEVEDGQEGDSYAKGAGGDFSKPKVLKAITDDSFTQKSEELLDNKARGFRYGKIPTPNLGKDGCLTDYKTFLKDMEEYKIKSLTQYGGTKRYLEFLDRDFKKFQNDNKKTVMYLVKEFEMKKSAQAYKRAQTDKTGIIDPLKLPAYKYSDDIFKKLTVIPDGKNHGMMMLLDWSGSMADVLMDTVKQLINLVEFCRKVNIPYEVYFFTSERGSYDEEMSKKGFSNKTGEFFFDNFHLVNCISHRMNKKLSDLALKTLYHMGSYFDNRYTWNRKNGYDNYADSMAASENYGIPGKYYLGNTPLNESLIYLDKLIPMFKKKYGIEKMTFITLTDGAANSVNGKIVGGKNQYDDDEYYKTNVYQIGKTKFLGEYRKNTSQLLNHIAKTYDVNIIGFYVIKRVKRWDIEKHINNYKDYNDKIQQYNKMRKDLTKDKALAVDEEGYNKFFILDGKKLKVENFDMGNAEVKKGTASELKRIFGKSMANRLVSRVVLNKFIKEVA